MRQAITQAIGDIDDILLRGQQGGPKISEIDALSAAVKRWSDHLERTTQTELKHIASLPESHYEDEH